MLILLSPAKTFANNSKTEQVNTTIPAFTTEAQSLVALLQHYQSAELAKLMSISDNLAQANVARFNHFAELEQRAAIFAFKGDVYQQLSLEKYQEKQLAFAQKTIRILSGLYGLLKAFDLIKEYRLEMSTKLTNAHGSNLYKFWHTKITDELNREPKQLLLNLASEEYAKVINFKQLKHQLVHVAFKEKKAGAYKIIGINAKIARGCMSNYLIMHQYDTLEKIKDFQELGYSFDEKLSQEDQYVFVR